MRKVIGLGKKRKNFLRVITIFMLSVFSLLELIPITLPIAIAGEEVSTVKIFVIHSATSTKMANDAAHQVMDLFNAARPDLVSFKVRNTAQVDAMGNDELKQLIEEADIVICHWIGTVTSNQKIINLVNTYPDIVTNKPNKLFIMLETGAQLTKLSKINGQTIFAGVPDTDIEKILTDLKNADINKLNNWKTTYPQIADWIDLALYQAAKGTMNYLNMYKSALKKYAKLNDGAWQTLWRAEWEPQPYLVMPNEFLYRKGKIYTTLAAYLNDYPLNPAQPTVGIVEMTSPALAGNMDHFEALIEKFTEKGLNVIPVVGAYSGTVNGQPANIYSAMVKFFTDAPTTADYERDPASYPAKIDALVSCFYFTLGSGFVSQTNKFLDNINVPVFRAITTTKRTEADWLVSDDGLSWSDTYYQIGIAETQGIIEPVLIATTEEETDQITGAVLTRYRPIGERVEKVVNRVYNWTKLKYASNAEKRVALVYYNYPPGKNNIGASYLNVPDSIIEILERLRQEGYNVGEVPANADELLKMMFERGLNVATWAPGELEKLADKAILWDAEEYTAWFNNLHPLAKKEVVEGPVGYIEEIIKLAVSKGAAKETALKTIDKWKAEMTSLVNTYPEKAQQAAALIEQMAGALTEVVNGNETAWTAFASAKKEFLGLSLPGLTGWGEPPGNIMTVERNGKKYIVIPGMYFGNIFVGPEPQRGWEADANKLYHSTIVPPPHNYLAWYAWVNQKFNADAQIHLGRHATYEWLPRKQVALTNADYSDIMIADKPSLYIYIVDGVGEGLQAKRRGLAVIISHLTPPMTTTALYGGLLELANLVNQYEKTAEGNPLKEQYAEAIWAKVKETHLDEEMDVDPDKIAAEDLVEKVEDYLYELQQMLMPLGLHTFGKPWDDEKIAFLARAMVSVDAGETSPSFQHLLAEAMGWNWEKLTLSQAKELDDRAYDLILQVISGEKTVAEAVAGLTDDSNLQQKLQDCLSRAVGYAEKIKLSFSNEMDALVEGLAGRYITPSTGNDPIRNPDALPTGRNFYGLSEEQIPTKVAWELGKKIADGELAKVNPYPEKIAAVVWCVETARDDGTMVSFVLRMLGVEPVWSGSTVQRVKATPLTQLNRPRIDVVVTTSGLFRDLFPRVAVNLDRAYRVALAASYHTIVADYPELQPSLDYVLQTLVDAKYTDFKGNDPLEQNYVAKHWVELARRYINQGVDPKVAAELAITRIFGPPVGDYGAGVNHAVEQPWTWNEREKLADLYLGRMGHSYTERGWGNTNVDLFKDLLTGINLAYHSRSTNLYGVLDNDDYFDYFGGLSLAIEKINGSAPDLNVLYYANPANPQTMSLQAFMMREMRTRYLNPEWIKGMMEEGYSGARTISEKFFAHLWGWQVTIPELVQDWLWQELVDVYVRDKYNIGISDWLATDNRVYSLIDITGTMLTAIQKGFWQADEATIKEIADTWAKAIVQGGVNCAAASCGNLELCRWATAYIDSFLLLKLNEIISNATHQAILTSEQIAALLPQKDQSTSTDSTSETTNTDMTSGTPSTDTSTGTPDEGQLSSDQPSGKPPASQNTTPGTPSVGESAQTPQLTVSPVPRAFAGGGNSGQAQMRLAEKATGASLQTDTLMRKKEEAQTSSAGPGKGMRAYEISKEGGKGRTVPVLAYALAGVALLLLLGAGVASYFRRA
ncbi:MAG: cobaltochelatase CobN [Eubacteriales bacterium]|nr:cobaltochelatase CobN [Eubacteriales bacterium]